MAPEDEQRIIVQCMRERLPLPNKIQNAPELRLGLELYFGAFFDLNTCRPMGMGGVAPIPWNCIYEYAIVHEFDEEQLEDLLFHTRHLDHVFITHFDNKSKLKHGKSTGIQSKNAAKGRKAR